MVDNYEKEIALGDVVKSTNKKTNEDRFYLYEKFGNRTGLWLYDRSWNINTDIDKIGNINIDSGVSLSKDSVWVWSTLGQIDPKTLKKNS